MAPNPDPKDSLRERSEPRESSSLNLSLDKTRMVQVRQEIGIIADRSFRQKLISEEAYEGYRQLAEGREEQELSTEMLENTRKFAKEHEAKAIRIHQKIESAIQAGIASETDEDFLMEQLIAENIDFVTKAEEVDGLIDAKLGRMRKDREKYDQFAAHPLIKENGCLQVDDNTSIEFPDQKAFLELSVPERRELLKRLEDALPKAKSYAEEHEDEEENKLDAEYEEKLDEAVEKGIIGKLTRKKFLDEFKDCDRKAKVYRNTDSVFEAQMKRYEVLWDQIRSELRGEALGGIEAQIDKKGYTELFTEFGRLKQSESQRLQNNYKVALDKYQQEGAIGRHTVAEFTMWMYRQDMSGKYDAEEQLPEQMERYEKLWEDAEELNEKQQKFLHSKIDVWGYTELENQYKIFKGELSGNEAAAGPDSKVLSNLHSADMKSVIVEAEEMLTDMGSSKKKAFMGIMDRMFRVVNRNKFDATSFEAGVRQKAVQADPGLRREASGRAGDDEVDFYEIGRDAEALEESGKSKVHESEGFIQVESKEPGGIGRQTQVTINEEEGLRDILHEDAEHTFKSNQSGGKDELSLAIYTSSGRTYEMDIQEVKALQDYLKESEKEEMDKVA